MIHLLSVKFPSTTFFKQCIFVGGFAERIREENLQHKTRVEGTGNVIKQNNILNIQEIRVMQFLIDCRKTKTKVITTANRNKGLYHHQPMKTQSEKQLNY